MWPFFDLSTRGVILLLPSLTPTKVTVSVFMYEKLPVEQRSLVSLTIGYLSLHYILHHLLVAVTGI
jgi:hypothetical protein